MKIPAGIGAIILAATVAGAQTNAFTALLQQGLFEEQANRNLDAAISDYQTLAAQFEQDRPMAATAVFRLGECYRAQGRTNEAAAEYQRILRDFSGEKTLAALSREDLAGMGMAGAPAPAAVTAAVASADAQLWNQLKDMSKENLAKVLPTLVPDAALNTLLQQLNDAEAKLAQLRSDYSPSNVVCLRQQALLDELNRQTDDRIEGIMQALKLRSEISPAPAAAGKPAGLAELLPSPVAEEEREIAAIKQQIQDSPDLINSPGAADRPPPLVSAAYSGHLRVAQFLLDNHASVDVKNRSGDTALWTAAVQGNKAMVELLLSHGADIDAVGSDGTALYQAAGHGFQAVTGVLLAHHAGVNLCVPGEASKFERLVPATGGESPLLAAAKGGHLEIVKMLLAAGADPNLEDLVGRTALSCAAAFGHREIITALLAAEADPNGGASRHDSPLLNAIYQQDMASAELLLRAGAHPDGDQGIYQRVQINSFLYNPGENFTPLFLAVSRKGTAMAELLLKYHADPNQYHANPHSGIAEQPFIFNALADTNFLERVMDAGALVDERTRDDYNWTPLAAAAQGDNAGALAILLAHGANPNAQNSGGATPLYWAAKQLDGTNVFALLLAAGANPNLRAGNAKTPLDLLKEGLATGDVSPEVKSRAAAAMDLLRRHGALDNPPDLNRIIVMGRGILSRNTNDWNHFTLLEALDWGSRKNLLYLGFPDFGHVIIARPADDKGAVKRMAVSLLNATNRLDCTRDVPLEFGDVVEIPEREHTLAEAPGFLTRDQEQAIWNYFAARAGAARLVVDGGVTVQLPIQPFFCQIGDLLQYRDARAALMSNSDMTRVKVTRRDPAMNQNKVWTLDCSNRDGHGIPDLWVRADDVIEVPLK